MIAGRHLVFRTCYSKPPLSHSAQKNNKRLNAGSRGALNVHSPGHTEDIPFLTKALGRDARDML
jgi:hypothetical protein